MKFEDYTIQVLFLLMLFVFNYGVLGYASVKRKYSKSLREVYVLHQTLTIIVSLVGLISMHVGYCYIWKNNFFILNNQNIGLFGFLAILITLFVVAQQINVFFDSYLRPEFKKNQKLNKFYLKDIVSRYFLILLFSIVIGILVGGGLMRMIDSLLSVRMILY